MPDFLPFALPDIGEEEIAEVVDSLRSGWLTTGPKTRRFEQAFAAFLGEGVEAIAVSSATAGLHLALEAAGVRPGDQVITTTFTFTATAEVVRYLGAHPVFVDIDPRTLNLDVAQVAAALTPRTRALIPVHFAGLACDMAPLLALARQRGLAVVEDAAHAFPATYRGQRVGTLASDAAVFSFYATKTLATGEGGMVVTRSPELAHRCRVMRLHGISRDAFDRYTARTPSWQYEVVAPGYKYNMMDLAAALGLHQLRKAPAFQRRRAQMARRYDEAFADLPVQLPPGPPPGETHAWHLYVLRLGDEACLGRDRFIERMAEEGVGCSVHFIPLHLQPYWRDTYALRPEHFPQALATFRRVLSLPLYTRMTEADQERVIAAVRGLLGAEDAVRARWGRAAQGGGAEPAPAP
jgi:dTDP-4-amino-4,6-dideoxygalactose transaminase